MRARLTEGHPEDKLIVYIGRLSAEKGIEAARLILEAIPGIRLALIGDGPHRAKLQRHFAGSSTHFAGYLMGAELASAHASADPFFMPSGTETLGLVVLEAMASGTPVVAAREGGLVDIVRDGVTGHLYPYRDILMATRLLRSRKYKNCCSIRFTTNRCAVRRDGRAILKRAPPNGFHGKRDAIA